MNTHWKMLYSVRTRFFAIFHVEFWIAEKIAEGSSEELTKIIQVSSTSRTYLQGLEKVSGQI